MTARLRLDGVDRTIDGTVDGRRGQLTADGVDGNRWAGRGQLTADGVDGNRWAGQLTADGVDEPASDAWRQSTVDTRPKDATFDFTSTYDDEKMASPRFTRPTLTTSKRMYRCGRSAPSRPSDIRLVTVIARPPNPSTVRPPKHPQGRQRLAHPLATVPDSLDSLAAKASTSQPPRTVSPKTPRLR